MKLQSIHFHQVGPLGNRSIDFTDDWTGDLHTRILLSGPNGCGKSTVLRAVAMLWEAAAHWLDHRKPLDKTSAVRTWLQRGKGVAVVLMGAHPTSDRPLGIVYGEANWAGTLQASRPDVNWLGEAVSPLPFMDSSLSLPESPWLESLSLARKKMILSHEPTKLPNVLFMDAEERRWVAPTRNVGDLLAESPALRWSPRYIASEDWKGQLEASLINLKLTQSERFTTVLAELNQFLIQKQIDADIEPGGNRLRVRLLGDSASVSHHTLDELSAGEHQVLIILYLIARWAEHGSVVLIDEPDLYLHPSLINSLLARVEQLVKALDGQLIITSHVPEVWSRYESIGHRIELGSRE